MSKLNPYFDAEKILAQNDATVEFSDVFVDSDGNRFRNPEMASWCFSWEKGVIGWTRPEWSQEQANRAGAMFIHLWEKGVEAENADTLAELWATHVKLSRT